MSSQQAEFIGLQCPLQISMLLLHLQPQLGKASIRQSGGTASGSVWGTAERLKGNAFGSIDLWSSDNAPQRKVDWTFLIYHYKIRIGCYFSCYTKVKVTDNIFHWIDCNLKSKPFYIFLNWKLQLYLSCPLHWSCSSSFCLRKIACLLLTLHITMPSCVWSLLTGYLL